MLARCPEASRKLQAAAMFVIRARATGLVRDVIKGVWVDRSFFDPAHIADEPESHPVRGYENSHRHVLLADTGVLADYCQRIRARVDASTWVGVVIEEWEYEKNELFELLCFLLQNDWIADEFRDYVTRLLQEYWDCSGLGSPN
jgi:hypothetical protein